MKAFIISDDEFMTDTSRRLGSQLKEYLTAKGFDIEETAVGRDTLAFCRGCFGCWVKKPGECVISDSMAKINWAAMTSDVVVYLCPIVFGQYSANIKNAIDRWLPNMLPFFIVRPDGSTMHPPRYESYPSQIMIGYGDSLLEEDKPLFIDIIKKHRSNVEAFIYSDDTSLPAVLDKFELSRVEGNL
jgi:hypothetical protein